MNLSQITKEELITEIIARIEHEGKLKRIDAVNALIRTLRDDYGGTE
jgi:hypothetical protein